MSSQAPTPHLRFTPPEVTGLPEVTQVAIHPDRLEIFSRNCWLTFPFATFAKRQQSRLSSFVNCLTRKPPLPKIVGVRQFSTDRRFVGFYTTPRLKIFTPPDVDESYSATYIFKINQILRLGGYTTLDLS